MVSWPSHTHPLISELALTWWLSHSVSLSLLSSLWIALEWRRALRADSWRIASSSVRPRRRSAPSTWRCGSERRRQVAPSRRRCSRSVLARRSAWRFVTSSCWNSISRPRFWCRKLKLIYSWTQRSLRNLWALFPLELVLRSIFRGFNQLPSSSWGKN